LVPKPKLVAYGLLERINLSWNNLKEAELIAKILFWIAVVLEALLMIVFVWVVRFYANRVKAKPEGAVQFRRDVLWQAQGIIFLLFLGATVAKYIF
jgi:hypothetical protein